MTATTKARLAVVGPMLGRHPGYVPFVGEVLAQELARAGHEVVLTSECLDRVARLLDITSTLLRHARRVDVQILQVYGGLSFIGEDIASRIAVLSGHRLIMHLHGGTIPEFMARHPAWSRSVLRRASVIVAPSPFLRKAIERFGFSARVIPNAVDIGRYPYRHRASVAPRLFWMRTFHDAYNPQMAIRAFALVRQFDCRATLVMAGQEKGTREEVQALAAELGVLDGVRFPGFLGADAKRAEAAAADIFLNTNRIDNTPVSVIEACAFGLPVVATDVGGIADLVTDGRTALLVPDDDPRAMADAVIRLLREPLLASRLSSEARRMAEGYAWERTSVEWQMLLEQVMAQPAGMTAAGQSVS